MWIQRGRDEGGEGDEGDEAARVGKESREGAECHRLICDVLDVVRKPPDGFIAAFGGGTTSKALEPGSEGACNDIRATAE